jgi:hypothetical protein
MHLGNLHRWLRTPRTCMIFAVLIGALWVAQVDATETCEQDVLGVDDQPGQKDVTQFCLETGTNIPQSCTNNPDFAINWNWDDTAISGGNTGDACALFDTDGDGFANYALCVTIAGTPATQSTGSPRLYSCLNNSPDKCYGAVQIQNNSTCSVGTGTDPFSATRNRHCNGTDCQTKDTQAACCIDLSDFPGATAAVLLDVCSFPSQIPNSDPSDCIVTVECKNDSQCDDGNACTLDTCVSGVCRHETASLNGTTCEDGNACTQGDTCQSGTCTSGTPVVCNASDQCHVAGTCDPATGTCSNPAKTNGSSCSDGNACTLGDTCQSGTCTSGTPVVCNASDQCHVAGTCDPATGTCSNPAKANGSSCSDGNACTLGDTCQSGTCTSGTPVVCSALDQCHVAGTCNTTTGVCSNPAKADNTACNDGNACTQTDTCQSGICTGSNPVVCNASDQCHVAGTCNTSTGVCSNPNAPNGTACTDHNACTSGETCQNGACTGGTVVVVPN